MRFIQSARDICERYHPGLIKALEDIPYLEREARDSPVIELFRAHDGPGLLVPREYGGHGAGALDALLVQAALGSYSPSLAAARTMHHFTAAMRYSLAEDADRLTPAQLALLNSVAPDRRLMASGWAEGRTQQNILVPSVTASVTDGGYLLNGSKKPCSLSRSMRILTASIAVPQSDGEPVLALAMVEVPAEGLSVHPFWENETLAAAQSDEVRLTDVFVPEELVVRTTAEDPGRLDDLQSAGFVWFEMLVTAGYLGAAATLVERVLDRERGGVAERAALAMGIESAFALLEDVALSVAGGLDGEPAVAKVLVARYTVQKLLAEVTGQAMELLGGIDFIRSAEHSRLATAVRALDFHPPGRGAAAAPLLRWFTGDPLELS